MKALTLCLAGALAFAHATRGSDAEPRNVVLGDLPLLFADDSGVASRENVTRTAHAAKQSSTPVLEPDKPWEGERVYIHGSVYQDESSGLFRMWYLTRQEAI